MNYIIEKWVFIAFMVIVFMMAIGAGLASHQRNESRLELAKAGRTSEDIIKICP